MARFGITDATNDLTATHDLAFSNFQVQDTFVVSAGANYQVNVKAI